MICSILDHWEMRSIRNIAGVLSDWLRILDHWEMRSIRNFERSGVAFALYFRSLGNALYPERTTVHLQMRRDFRSLGNALYPEPLRPFLVTLTDFRSLGNALYPEPGRCRHAH